MIKKYYLNDDGFAYDGKYFDTREEAEKYARDNQSFISDSERLEVTEFVGLFFVVYDSKDGVSKYEASGLTWQGKETEKFEGLCALFKHLGKEFEEGEFKALSDGGLTPFDVIENHFDKTEYLGDVINI